jgi:AsmA protein
LEEFHVSGGTIASTVKLDASKKKTVRLNYELSVSGLEARPILKTLVNNDRLSGKTEFEAKGSTKGKSQQALINSLQGKGQFKFLDGAIHGVNIPATLRKVKSLGFDKEAGEEVKTDFTELSGSFIIKKGVLKNRDLRMLAPLVRVKGKGSVPLPKQAVNYDMTATLVASLQGQGGEDSLAGLPIPIKIKGPWENISYNVDWKNVFGGISADPERLDNLPQNLRALGKSLGVDLSGPEPQDSQKSANTDEGGSPLDLLRQLQKNSSEEPTGSATTKESEDKEKPQTVEPAKLLNDLLGK